MFLLATEKFGELAVFIVAPKLTMTVGQVTGRLHLITESEVPLDEVLKESSSSYLIHKR